MLTTMHYQVNLLFAISVMKLAMLAVTIIIMIVVLVVIALTQITECCKKGPMVQL